MPSYFKSQWPYLFGSLIFFGISIYWFFQPAPDPSTIEGLIEDLKIFENAFGYLFCGLLWLFMSVVGYNRECIEVLDKRVSQIEKRAITDVEEISDNYYVCKRKLGPDKEEY
jgi:hypothetical protein